MNAITLNIPALQVMDGAVRADSRDIARAFGKQHAHILRAIDDLCAARPQLALSNFGEGSYTLPETGNQQHRHYLMDRDGFSLLVMGFTGKKALDWKLAYIDAFNRMEAEIRARPAGDPMAALNDPATMRTLLLGYSEKVIALETANAELAGKAGALDRISGASGSLCVTDAAKALGMGRNALFAWLREHRWIYRRAGGKHWLGYADKDQQGLVEHKVNIINPGAFNELLTEHVLITPKGLARLVEMMRPAGPSAGPCC